jgi:hypothetical protein
MIVIFSDMIKTFTKYDRNVFGYDLKDSGYRKNSGYGKIHSGYNST